MLEQKRRREEVEYRNTHCPSCNATDIESKTYESTYEGTEEQIDYEDRYDREGRYIGHSEHRRSVPATKRSYWTGLTCTKCGNDWRKE